jgi:glyoxylase-like metal-dependent hydrolase (beta-lactamase superfamily II)
MDLKKCVFALLASICAFRGFAADPPAASTRNYDVEKIGDGIYAVIRRDWPGLMCDGNTVFIINDEDVVVVDAPEASKDMLAELRKLTSKPVRYVINTHWHDDHITGNHVYREAFPGVEFIGHKSMLEYLPTTGLANRKGMIEGAPKFAEQERGLLEKNRNFAGEELTGEERAAFSNDVRLVDRYMKEVPGAEIIPPSITVEDGLTLHRGKRTIDIRHLGNGHTAADLVVQLPEEGIVIAGDLVVSPVPLIGDPQSHIADWGASLRKLLALRPSLIVPGHGKVEHDDSYVKLMADLMTFVTEETRAAVSRGESLEQARKSVNLSEFEGKFAGDSRLKRFVFRNYVTFPSVGAAYGEASAKP